MTRKCAWLCLPGLVLLAVGCGSKGTITGTVSYKGTPIPQGTILFTPASGGAAVSVPINDGKYTAEKVSAGPAKVAVVSLYSAGGPADAMTQVMQGGKGMGPPPDAKIPEEARKLFSGGGGGSSKKGLQIPDKYGNPDESGLTYTVTGGSQTKDFNLD
jgi:hypothetical protein